MELGFSAARQGNRQAIPSGEFLEQTEDDSDHCWIFVPLCLRGEGWKEGGRGGREDEGEREGEGDKERGGREEE